MNPKEYEMNVEDMFTLNTDPISEYVKGVTKRAELAEFRGEENE